MINNKYSEGKIYKISNTLNSKIYVGSTIKTLSDRLNCHILTSKATVNGNFKENSKWRVFLRENDEEIFKIELIELFPCNSKIELRIREQYYIDTLNPQFNSIKSYQTEDGHKTQKKEYRDKWLSDKKNKDYYLNQCKEYYEKNKKKKNEKVLCVCGKLLNKQYLRYHERETKEHLKFIESQKNQSNIQN